MPLFVGQGSKTVHEKAYYHHYLTLHLNSIPLCMLVVGLLGRFHFLAIVIKVAMSKPGQVCGAWCWVFWVHAKADIVGSYCWFIFSSFLFIFSTLTFSTLMLRVAASVYSLINSEWGFFHLTPFRICFWLFGWYLLFWLGGVRWNIKIVLISFL